jgi:hypothetical protein
MREPERGDVVVKAWMPALVTGAIVTIACAVHVGAQTSPTPGPTNPTPQPSPLTKPGSDLVINPTAEQCEKGWRPDTKWTKEQFEAFCTQLKTSK